MTENDDLQKISRFVEMGGTMTAQHCTNCGAPMIRYQGKTFCPLCDVAYVSDEDDHDHAVDTASGSQNIPVSNKGDISENDASASSERSDIGLTSGSISAEADQVLSSLSDERVPVRTANVTSSSKHREDLVDVTLLINRKLVSIGILMQDETDPRRIAEYLDIIEKGLTLIERYG